MSISFDSCDKFLKNWLSKSGEDANSPLIAQELEANTKKLAQRIEEKAALIGMYSENIEKLESARTDEKLKLSKGIFVGSLDAECLKFELDDKFNKLKGELKEKLNNITRSLSNAQVGYRALKEFQNELFQQTPSAINKPVEPKEEKHFVPQKPPVNRDSTPELKVERTERKQYSPPTAAAIPVHTYQHFNLSWETENPTKAKALPAQPKPVSTKSHSSVRSGQDEWVLLDKDEVQWEVVQKPRTLEQICKEQGIKISTIKR